MEKALRMKERQEAMDKEIEEINAKRLEEMKEKCLMDVARKGKAMDFLGRMHKERREALQEERILRAQEASQILPNHIEQTQKLAAGILRLKNKSIGDQKRRQVLRAQNIELKNLESQLKSTYAAKTAQVQLREREAIRENLKHRELQADKLRAKWYNNDNFELQLREEHRLKQKNYRKALQDQLVGCELARQERTEEAHRERKLVEEVSGVLHSENLGLAMEKAEKVARVRAEQEVFFRARETWKCREKEALRDEFARQAQVVVDKMVEEKDQASRRTDRSAARDLAMERTARRMLDEEVRRTERENLLRELLVEEENEAANAERKEVVFRKARMKSELLADMERQRKVIAENKARDADVNAAFGKYLADEYQAAVQQDARKREERRAKGIRYGEDLRASQNEKRAAYAEQVLLRQALKRKDEELELRRLEEVSLERSKMLYEHAPKLEGFLKPGTIRPEDQEYMRSRRCSAEVK